MKARLINFKGITQLLLCTGKIKDVSNTEAYDFLLNFQDPSYYSGTGKWNYENLSMEEYRGDTIAVVDDNDTLHVFNATLFREIFLNKDAQYLTVPEYAELHGKKTAIIRRLCLDGRIPGAIFKGKWLIPNTAPYPRDARVGGRLNINESTQER